MSCESGVLFPNYGSEAPSVPLLPTLSFSGIHRRSRSWSSSLHSRRPWSAPGYSTSSFGSRAQLWICWAHLGVKCLSSRPWDYKDGTWRYCRNSSRTVGLGGEGNHGDDLATVEGGAYNHRPAERVAHQGDPRDTPGPQEFEAAHHVSYRLGKSRGMAIVDTKGRDTLGREFIGQVSEDAFCGAPVPASSAPRPDDSPLFCPSTLM